MSSQPYSEQYDPNKQKINLPCDHGVPFKRKYHNTKSTIWVERVFLISKVKPKYSNIVTYLAALINFI